MLINVTLQVYEIIHLSCIKVNTPGVFVAPIVVLVSLFFLATVIMSINVSLSNLYSTVSTGSMVYKKQLIRGGQAQNTQNLVLDAPRIFSPV